LPRKPCLRLNTSAGQAGGEPQRGHLLSQLARGHPRRRGWKFPPHLQKRGCTEMVDIRSKRIRKRGIVVARHLSISLLGSIEVEKIPGVVFVRPFCNRVLVGTVCIGYLGDVFRSTASSDKQNRRRPMRALRCCRPSKTRFTKFGLERADGGPRSFDFVLGA
jgi:hypothetical protein